MKPQINRNNEETLSELLIATIILIFSLILSASALYNSLEKVKGKKGIYNDEEAYQINLINRIIVLCVFGYFLYVSYEITQNGGQKNEDTIRGENLQLVADALAFLAAIIALYIAYRYYGQDSVSDSEQPIV